MTNRIHHFAAAVLAIFAIAALVEPISPARAAPGERFEVTSLKAVRPTLVNTLSALQKRDRGGARDAFEAYDSAWNGIEFYINTRSRPMYDLLEHGSGPDHQGLGSRQIRISRRSPPRRRACSPNSTN